MQAGRPAGKIRRVNAPRSPVPERWFDLSRFAGLGEALDEATQRAGSNACLIETDRGRVTLRLTYRAFRARARALAAALAARGLGPDDRVAVLLPNGPRWLEGAYAALRLGCVLVPLDARAPADDVAGLLRHAEPRALLVHGPLWRRLAREDLPPLDLVLVHEPLEALTAPAAPWSEATGDEAGADEAGADHASADHASADHATWDAAPPPPAPRRPADLAAIVYSSGTSGAPKGCMVSHGAYLAQMEALANHLQVREDDVYLSVLPTHHAIDFMCGFLVSFLCGGSVVHLRTLRPEYVTRACKEQQVTLLAAVPALLDALLAGVQERIEAQPPLAREGLAALRRLNGWLTERRARPAVSRALLAPIHQALGGRLRTIFAGGAPVPAGTARALYELGLPVAIGYGLSEACAVVSVNDLRPFRADTVGAPLPGVEVRIAERDADGRGELWVRGPQVFAGYWRDPARTAEVLREDGWLRTGDRAVLDATGHLRLVGRLKDVIVTAGGKNVSPEDVEARFGEAPAAELAVVAAHRVWERSPGEDEALLLAARPKEGQDEADLLEALRRLNRRLPSHQRARGVLLVGQPFPRTTSLKLQRDRLAAALQGRARDEVLPL